MITAAAALHKAAMRLAQSGIESPRREARLLLAHALGLPPGALPPEPAALVNEALLNPLVDRRAAHEPLAFITGHRGFWTLDLETSPDTLIPRADSETLIEAALAAFPDRRPVRRVLDLGTGTGCLLLASLSEFPAAFGIGTDLSPNAAALARRNASACGLGARSAFMAGSWAEAVQGRFDLVLCNPPYIPTADIASLMPDVANYEPIRALDGGDEGLHAYRTLIPALPGLLAPSGAAILEIGEGQAPAVSAIAHAAGFGQVHTRLDLGGHVRALTLTPD